LVRCLVFLENQQRGCELGLDQRQSSYLAFVLLLSMVGLADHNSRMDHSYSISVGLELVVVDNCSDAIQLGSCMVVAAGSDSVLVVEASSFVACYPLIAAAPCAKGTCCRALRQEMGFDCRNA